jgi:hypothetical protein
LATSTEVEGDSNPVFDSADKLGIGGIRRCRQVPGTGFAVDGEQAPQRQLEATTIAPGADGIGKADWLGAAFHSYSAEGVGHEALAKPGVDRSQHQIRIGRPNKIRGARGEGVLGRWRGDPQAAASADPEVGGPNTKRKTAECASDWRRIREGSIELDSAGYLCGETSRYYQIR